MLLPMLYCVERDCHRARKVQLGDIKRRAHSFRPLAVSTVDVSVASEPLGYRVYKYAMLCLVSRVPI